MSTGAPKAATEDKIRAEMLDELTKALGWPQHARPQSPQELWSYALADVRHAAKAWRLENAAALVEQEETRSAPLPQLLRGDIEIAAAVVLDSWTDWWDEHTGENFRVVEVAIHGLRNTIRDRMAHRRARS